MVWLFVLIAVQALSGIALLVGAAVFCLFGRAVIQRSKKLVWRTRWLLVSLFVILAWGTAGDPLWQHGFAPTHEGLHLAWTHSGRLLLVLMAVAAFLETMSLPDLLTATHTVLSPLRRLGFDPDRGVVRLMLALRYAEDLPRPRDWRALLDLPVALECTTVDIHTRPFGWVDVALAVVVVALIGVLIVLGVGGF